MRCTNGHEVPEGNAFCGVCGGAAVEQTDTTGLSSPGLPPSPGTPPRASTAGSPQRPIRRGYWVALAVLVVLIVGGVAFYMSRSTKLELAYEACETKVDSMATISLEDGGSSLVINTPGEEDVEFSATDALESLDAMECVLSELEAPAFVKEQMNTTTSLMGRQEVEWGGLTAT